MRRESIFFFKVILHDCPLESFVWTVISCPSALCGGWGHIGERESCRAPLCDQKLPGRTVYLK